MYGVIAEDPSDVETLQVLVRRLSHNQSLPIKGKGYSGCGALLHKGARQLRLFAELGCKRFIICYDADGPDATARRQEVMRRIVTPSGIPAASCLALVPVQEIEAWILADLHHAVPQVIPSWKPAEVFKPESIASPKEYLTALSRGSNKKPRYAYTVHDTKVAHHLDFTTVQRKCPSFRPLFQFVAGNRRITPPPTPFPGTGTRSLWASTGTGGASRYVCQLATASAWGEVIAHVHAIDPAPEELTRLCEYGWAALEPLEAELQSILAAKPNARLRATLANLQSIAANRGEGRYIGLDDGTR